MVCLPLKIVFGDMNNVLYFTDIAPTGGYPETWAFATNVIPFVGPNGTGLVKR